MSLHRPFSRPEPPLRPSKGEGFESSLFDAAAATVDFGKEATRKSERFGIRLIQKLASNDPREVEAPPDARTSPKLLKGPVSRVRGLIKNAAAVDLAPISRSAAATFDSFLPDEPLPAKDKVDTPREGA